MTVGTRTGPADLALPLRVAEDLDPLMGRLADARVVCIGEASHGTHEFYAWRALLTRRLVEEHGFDFVAVEGDWPDCYTVSCSVTGAATAAEDPLHALTGFDRWPTWMWANHEVLDFTRWLRQHNATRPADRRVGFYGLDVYSLWKSLRAVVGYLERHHPEHVTAALDAFRCFEPYAENPQAYARATRLVPTTCELEVVAMLSELQNRHAATLGDQVTGGAETVFAAEQNARAVTGAEAYYRAMMRGGPEAWNLRDLHMADTLDRLVGHHDTRRSSGPAKAVVWEHNTHIGDARYTDMTQAGMLNVGQLVRERYGEDDTVLVGLGGHHGTVVAARSWGATTEVMQVPPAWRPSIESLLHESLDGEPALFVFGDDLPDWAGDENDHRAIGVVYQPEAERWGNYVPTVLGRRYDAFLWFDETKALSPLVAAP